MIGRAALASVLLGLPGLLAGCAGEEGSPVDASLRVTADAFSGWATVPQLVTLSAPAGARLLVTLDGSDPMEGGTPYAGPIGVSAPTLLRAVAARDGRVSPELRLDLRVSVGPAERALGRLEVADERPILQDLTRAALLAADAQGRPVVVYSTLESYHRNESGDRFLLHSFSPDGERRGSAEVLRSVEARSWAHAPALGGFALGASLRPAIHLYDPSDGSVRLLFEGPDANAWLHDLAVDGTTIWTILSTPGRAVDGYAGLLRVDAADGSAEVVPFPDERAQNYGGVQTVDPTGRVWYYRAYPMERAWYDEAGHRPREAPGWPGWAVEGWDSFEGRGYLVLSSAGGEVRKEPFDLETLRPADAPDDEEERLFRRLVPVDLHRKWGPAAEGLQADPSDGSFHLVGSDGTIRRLGAVDLGRLDLSGFHGGPQETATRWTSPRLGEVQVLGLDGDGALLLWQRGRKTLVQADLATGETRPRLLDAPHVSPSEITSLVADRDGVLYGGGILTFTHLFRHDPRTGETTLLREAVPNSEGQVNMLVAGPDGALYGAAYPGAVPFRFDPSMPWAPGEAPGANPASLGPVGHRSQMRALRGAVASDGSFWYESVGDYADPVAHALVHADFAARRVRAWTDLDDGVPRVADLALWDDERLVVCGERDGPVLAMVSRRDGTVLSERPTEGACGAMLRAEGLQGEGPRVYVAVGRDVSVVGEDLSLRLVHRAGQDVARMIELPDRRIVLVGLAHAEAIDPATARWSTWWEGPEPLLADLNWRPVAWSGGSLYVGRGEELARLTP